jgi:hypothetical protein
LKNKKVLFLKKCFFGRSQFKNKKALFTVSIFREGFGQDHMVPRIKTVAKNWDSKAPSAGTILAYLETTA